MFKVFVNNGAVTKHQMVKEVAKPAAREILQKKSDLETTKSKDPWWKSRVDAQEAAKNARIFRKDYERTLPEKLSSQAQNEMWKRAKQLKDEFIIGMLSREELHPTKSFLDNGTTKHVVDEGQMRASRSTERELAWQRANENKIKEFKNLMRHLNPEDPNAGDIERFRPKLKGIR
jgi:hypothetical protein